MSLTFEALRGLPPPDVVKNVSYEAILSRMRNKAVELRPEFAGFIDLETEPARIILEVAAYEAMLLLARVNDAARARLLPFAYGGDLDQLASFYDVVRMTGETDERFKRRVVLDIAGRSPGGTAERYRARAMEASIDVEDAAIWGDQSSPVVHVAVFSTSSTGAASADLLDTVRNAMNDPAVRMVNDTIEVTSAVTIVQPVAANIWLLDGTRRAVFEGLAETLADAWRDEGGLGRDLTRSWIVSKLMQPGVYKVEVITPATDIIVVPETALALGAITLDLQGRDT